MTRRNLLASPLLAWLSPLVALWPGRCAEAKAVEPVEVWCYFCDKPLLRLDDGWMTPDCDCRYDAPMIFPTTPSAYYTLEFDGETPRKMTRIA